jgi:thiamine pyrophosphate-dependent acetolactate synthase large subunit-like protein
MIPPPRHASTVGEKMSRTVSELLVGVLEQIGVRHIFGLIGDSLNPLADAVRHSKIEFREAIEFPNPDFAALARACGGHGFVARKPNDLMAAISEALAIDGPTIVDAVVAADEMPNMPHIELEQAGYYAVAKIKEAVLAVTGG